MVINTSPSKSPTGSRTTWSYDGPPLVKLGKFCEISGMTNYLARKLCKANKLPCVKSGRGYYVQVYDALEMIRSGDLNKG